MLPLDGVREVDEEHRRGEVRVDHFLVDHLLDHRHVFVGRRGDEEREEVAPGLLVDDGALTGQLLQREGVVFEE